MCGVAPGERAFTKVDFIFNGDFSGTNRVAFDALEYSGELAPIPVPTGLPLLATGLAGLAWLRRRRRAA
jgi:hypothetical protein